MTPTPTQSTHTPPGTWLHDPEPLLPAHPSFLAPASRPVRAANHAPPPRPYTSAAAELASLALQVAPTERTLHVLRGQHIHMPRPPCLPTTTWRPRWPRTTYSGDRARLRPLPPSALFHKSPAALFPAAASPHDACLLNTRPSRFRPRNALSSGHGGPLHVFARLRPLPLVPASSAPGSPVRPSRGRIAGRSLLPVVPFGAKRVLPRPAPFHSASGSSLFHSAGAYEDLLWFRTAPIMPLASLGVNRAPMARCDHSTLHLPALERCFIATRHCHMAHAMSLERLRLLSSAPVLFLASWVALPSAHVHVLPRPFSLLPPFPIY
ncbi:hypothetical protein V8E36_001559 [Tilletia maclaganii]